MSDDPEEMPDDDFEERVQDEAEDYLADVHPGLNPDDRQADPRGQGCLLILALPGLLGLWWLG